MATSRATGAWIRVTVGSPARRSQFRAASGVRRTARSGHEHGHDRQPEPARAGEPRRARRRRCCRARTGRGSARSPSRPWSSATARTAAATAVPACSISRPPGTPECLGPAIGAGHRLGRHRGADPSSAPSAGRARAASPRAASGSSAGQRLGGGSLRGRVHAASVAHSPDERPGPDGAGRRWRRRLRGRAARRPEPVERQPRASGSPGASSRRPSPLHRPEGGPDGRSVVLAERAVEARPRPARRPHAVDRRSGRAASGSCARTGPSLAPAPASRRPAPAADAVDRPRRRRRARPTRRRRRPGTGREPDRPRSVARAAGRRWTRDPSARASSRPARSVRASASASAWRSCGGTPAAGPPATRPSTRRTFVSTAPTGRP